MTDRENIARMKELSSKLREASRAYYALNREIMSNYEYDALYDELEKLEKETGIILAGSPTQSVGYEVVDSLPKERHASPMLSLDKTKDPEVLRSFIDGHKTLISWKLDGLTVVLTYRGGQLFKAVTRGNGLVGEVITANARTFQNIPLRIAYKGELVLRGEAVISYADFDKINEQISDADAKYKNPRNLCSGSVRQLDSRITAQRKVRFYAFMLVQADGVDFQNSHAEEFRWLAGQGFDVVEHRMTDSDTMDETIQYYAEKIRHFEIPSDGLVALYDDISYGISLGSTAKFPRNSFAFKWRDEIRETTLRKIEWSASRTGLINPVAVFDPVELEGTTVSRASVHNLSIMKELQLGIGDKVTVYKANMIIPQIAENLTKSGNMPIPDHCPVCGGATKISCDGDTETLVCPNPDCMAKKIKGLTLFVSRDALNIDGLSESTLEKFVSAGFIHSSADIFHLDRHREAIISMEGFGEKSYANLIASCEKARKTTLSRLLYSLGIPNVGTVNARVIVETMDEDVEKIRHAEREELSAIDGIGPVIADSVAAYFEKKENQDLLDSLLRELEIEKPAVPEERRLTGLTFVVTGSLHHFSNRDELKTRIQAQGGKVTGTVTSRTDYLINNDAASNSAKNRKARQLGTKIITEDEFIDMLKRKSE